MPTGKGQGNWGEYRALILEELRRLSESIGQLDKKLDDLRFQEIEKIRKELAGFMANVGAELAVLKLKAGAMGAIGGSVFSALIAWIFSKRDDL